MVSKSMRELGSRRSSIRELFEYGRKRMEAMGPESVFDFSLGNPSIPAPRAVNEAIMDILKNESSTKVHGYTSAAGANEALESIANNLNRIYGTSYTSTSLYITYGAAMALTCTFKALTIDETSEFICFAPCFPEYSVFCTVGGGKLNVIEPDFNDFQINFKKFEEKINFNTQAVIINSPNNPTGVIYTEETIKHLANILETKSREYGHPIYLVSDEPYRELTYDGIKVPFVANYYNDTIICYSYSKSLSLPGERIGYVLMPDTLTVCDDVRFAIAGAARSLGCVCAPSLMQLVIARCSDLDVQPDLTSYIENRDILCEAFDKMGYVYVKPQGAFYLFFKAPDGNSLEFCEKAKNQGVLVVAGEGFYCPGWMRLSYCVDKDMIKRSLPFFEKLMEGYR